ncbi:hypothetical protein MC885_019661 [Smutsia gigantea]|nr:hypothetical protein MC885_019661 [Smutsia gigantea]
MKVSAAPLCLLLTTAAFSAQVLSQPDALSALSTCCFTFNNKRIPLQKLKSYRITSSQCPQEAVMWVENPWQFLTYSRFRTKLGKDICVYAKENWVRNYVKHLDQKSSTQKT